MINNKYLNNYNYIISNYKESMENQLSELKQIKNKDIKEYTLKSIKTIGKVVDVYDGDTCKIVLLINGKQQKHSCRLSGIDTPEMKPLLKKVNREKEIEHSHKCRNRLLQLVTTCNVEDINAILKKKQVKKMIDDDNNKIITVECCEFDKYGRLLVNLFTDETCEEHVNKILITENYAKSYDGGKKNVFTY